jgi:uracil-DNA glycosylase
VLIIVPTPGSTAHDSGVPWTEVSSDRLRGRVGFGRVQFEDDRMVAPIPTGFRRPSGRS